ncbi:hypothetical protein GH714_020065 [Hevea brasiliensis]|uniref:Uncharacterized protein n=1 Tax=Hevea brasiliensis TaxID=3981 RepID=A0A6A6N384_HEVBR|nr:hypothetical protein GH714_020065 [Hevea brasiliensis]
MASASVVQQIRLAYWRPLTSYRIDLFSLVPCSGMDFIQSAIGLERRVLAQKIRYSTLHADSDYEDMPSRAACDLRLHLCVSIISAPVCFIAEENRDAWRLRPDIALLAIIYSAIFGPCYSTIVHAWGVSLEL